MTEAPKKIWLQVHREEVRLENSDLFMVGVTWSHKQIAETDIKYYRADTYHACMEAGMSLDYHLHKITSAVRNNPEFADMLADAQPALDKWDRFLDGEYMQAMEELEQRQMDAAEADDED